MLLATSKHTFFNSSLLLCNIQWCPQRMRMYTVRFLWTIFKTKVCNYIEIIIFFKLQVVFTVSSLWVTLKSIFHPFCFVMNRDIIQAYYRGNLGGKYSCLRWRLQEPFSCIMHTPFTLTQLFVELFPNFRNISFTYTPLFLYLVSSFRNKSFTYTPLFNIQFLL